MLTDQELQQFYKQGFIVYPEEDEESFLQRVKSAATTLEKSLILKKIFSIDSVQVELSYSNRGLSFLEGGALFLTTPPRLQLRHHFQKNKRYLGLYSKEEVVAHELVHYMRAGFEEPLFEEFLAYQTSKSRLRRFLGPILRSSGETLLFFLLFPYFFGRLAYFSWIFQKCYQKLRGATLLLKDEEIRLFARLERDEVMEWIEENSCKSLRIRQLRSSLSSASNP